jgi:hypothetical protein
VDKRAVEEGATPDVGAIDLPEFLAFVDLTGGLGREIFRRDGAKMIILVQINGTENRAAQTRRALNDRLEYWLDVCWRMANNTQYFARGGLLLKRLFKFASLLAESLLKVGNR